MCYISSGKPVYTAGELETESGIWQLFSCDDRVDIYSASPAIKANITVHKRENRIIPPKTDIFSRQKFRPTLTNNDVTGDDQFAAEFFHAQPFADAIAAVLDAALSFFMSHKESRRLLLRFDGWSPLY